MQSWCDLKRRNGCGSHPKLAVGRGRLTRLTSQVVYSLFCSFLVVNQGVLVLTHSQMKTRPEEGRKEGRKEGT